MSNVIETGGGRHLVHRDVRHPDAVLLVDGDHVRHEEHVLSPRVHHVAGGVQRQDGFHGNGLRLVAGVHVVPVGERRRRNLHRHLSTLACCCWFFGGQNINSPVKGVYVPGPVSSVEYDRIPVDVNGHPGDLSQPVRRLLRRPVGHRVQVHLGVQALAFTHV